MIDYSDVIDVGLKEARRVASFFNRIQFVTMPEILKALKPRCSSVESCDWNDVFIFTNGLPENEFFRRLALHCTDNNAFEAQKNLGYAVSFDDEIAVQRDVEDIMGRIHERRIMVFDKGDWFNQTLTLGFGDLDWVVSESAQIYSIVHDVSVTSPWAKSSFGDGMDNCDDDVKELPF